MKNLLDHPAKLRLNRIECWGRNRRILPLEPKFFLEKGTISTTKTLFNAKSFLTRVYENSREPNCPGIKESESLRYLRT
ncbi:MAG: hypothetical protein DMF48_01890 [Verrucomicrobia bacterium]|nr:MAG: hypothetical protein DMF48_01890 [Verrucomicrobiota bacterium]